MFLFFKPISLFEQMFKFPGNPLLPLELRLFLYKKAEHMPLEKKETRKFFFFSSARGSFLSPLSRMAY